MHIELPALLLLAYQRIDSRIIANWVHFGCLQLRKHQHSYEQLRSDQHQDGEDDDDESQQIYW